jgi:hypothetical protein
MNIDSAASFDKLSYAVASGREDERLVNFIPLDREDLMCPGKKVSQQVKD